MADIHSLTVLTLRGDDAPIEVRVEPDTGGVTVLSAVIQWKDARIKVIGYPNDVESFFKDGLDLAQDAMESLTPCQRRGKHRSDPAGTEDGCPDCQMEPAVPAFASNGAPW